MSDVSVLEMTVDSMEGAGMGFIVSGQAAFHALVESLGRSGNITDINSSRYYGVFMGWPVIISSQVPTNEMLIVSGETAVSEFNEIPL